MVIVWEWGIYPQKAEYHIGGNHASSIKQIKDLSKQKTFLSCQWEFQDPKMDAH